ncbi:unnamed protein product [Agarophyton chilense]
MQASQSNGNENAKDKRYCRQRLEECAADIPSSQRRHAPRPPKLKLSKASPATIPTNSQSPPELRADGEVFAAMARKGKRHHNLEDRFAAKDLAQRGLRPFVSLFGIFDGHGGVEAADLSSERLFGFILSAYRRSGDIRAAMRTAFIKMDNTLFQLYLVTTGSITKRSKKTSSMSDHSLPRTDIPVRVKKLSGLCGTTATVVALVENTMTIAYVGDSRVIAFGKKDVVRLSEDHRESNPTEQTRCVKEGGYFFKGRINGVLSLTRSIGDVEQRTLVLAEPDVNEVQLAGFEAVVIASDGVWDVLRDDEVAEITRKHIVKSEGLAAQRILDTAQGKGVRDDVSAMVVNLKKYGRRLTKLSMDSVSTPLSCADALTPTTTSLSALSLSTPRYLSPEPESLESLSPGPSPLPTPHSKRTNVWK